MVEKDKKRKTQKKYTIQWYVQFSRPEDVIMHKLREFLFDKKLIDTDTKYACLKFCALNTIFLFADELIPNFTFEAEELVNLIETFEAMLEGYRKRLNMLQQVQTERQEKALKDVGS